MTHRADDSTSDDPDGEDGPGVPELRADGGEVAAHNPGVRRVGGEGRRPEPPQPELRPLCDRGEPPSSQPGSQASAGTQFDNLPESVETHFTPAELHRLRRIARCKNSQSAWVIKRLLRESSE